MFQTGTTVEALCREVPVGNATAADKQRGYASHEVSGRGRRPGVAVNPAITTCSRSERLSGSPTSTRCSFNGPLHSHHTLPRKLVIG